MITIQLIYFHGSLLPFFTSLSFTVWIPKNCYKDKQVCGDGDLPWTNIPCKILTEISARSHQDLSENLGEFLAGEISRSRRDPGEIPARSRDLAGQKLAEILAEILKSHRPKARRDSRQDLVEISKSRRPKTRRERFELRSRRDSHRNITKLTRRETGSILPRYQNVITRRYHINFIERNNSGRQNKHTEIRLHYV